MLGVAVEDDEVRNRVVIQYGKERGRQLVMRCRCVLAEGPNYPSEFAYFRVRDRARARTKSHDSVALLCIFLVFLYVYILKGGN